MVPIFATVYLRTKIGGRLMAEWAQWPLLAETVSAFLHIAACRQVLNVTHKHQEDARRL